MGGKKSRRKHDDDGEEGQAKPSAAASSSSLVDSIFGNSSESTTKTTTNTTTSLFSKPPAKRAAAVGAVATQPPQKKKNKKKKKKEAPSHKLTPSKTEILDARKRQSQHSLIKEALDFPGVFEQEQESDEYQLPLEEQVVEMAQSVKQHGVCIIRDCITTQVLQSTLVPWSKDLFGNVCEALDQRQIAWRTTSLQNKQPDMFRFRQAASRCKGRMDVALLHETTTNSKDSTQSATPAATLASPFQDANTKRQILENPTFYPVVEHLLGGSTGTANDVQLVYAGLIFNLPSSEDQPWHQDGVPLFPEHSNAAQIQASLPVYALNVFIPLESSDASLEKGPTEFMPGSHQWLDEQLERVNNDTGEDIKLSEDVISPLLRQGDVLIYDYRVCHRGTSNLVMPSSVKKDDNDDAIRKGTRKILYLMYARPWFTDHVNFDYTKSAESIWDVPQSNK